MENFAKLKTQDIKSQAERKDIYLDNDFIAISKYIKITDEDINRLKKWDINEVFIKDLENEDATHNSVQDFEKFLREYKVFKNIYLNIIKQTKNNLGNFRHNNLVNMKELNEIIDGLLDIMNRNLNSFIALLSILHSTSVSISLYIISSSVPIISDSSNSLPSQSTLRGSSIDISFLYCVDFRKNISISFSMQRDAYVASFMFLSVLKVFTAFIRPIVPIEIRSSTPVPVDSNFFAI